MIIGFRTRMTTTFDTLSTLSIHVHSNIISDLDYQIFFRHIRGRNPTDATVETADLLDPTFDEDFDARFGDRRDPNNPLDPLETVRVLQKGRLEPLRPLTTIIFGDVIPDFDKCYTINILTTGERSDFSCNKNDYNQPDDFFCDHTICILDDDGQLRPNRPVNAHACLYATCSATYFIY